ncbi:MAG TPA: hypothetical protein VGX96_18335 [Candidatus Elarobacter sp.]|nr:hypothetical protein [Candidatus Elarobacter sp.]
MTEFMLNVLAGLVAAGLGFSLGIGYSRIRAFRRFRHLERLIPRDRRVQLVLPSAQVKDFLVKGESTVATFPSNVLIMPMPEGEAIATLVNCLRSLPGGVRIDLTDDGNVSRFYGLTISVGGPSVNYYSRRLLATDYPAFTLKYPDHVAAFGSTTFVPQRGKSDDLLEDYGFLFCSRHDEEHRCIVLCGVWGTGTRAAVQGLMQLPPSSDAARSLATSSRTFLAFRTEISGLESGTAQLMIHTVQE